jgi:hypothetical protein
MYFKVGKTDFHIEGIRQMGKEKFIETYRGKVDIWPHSINDAYHMITHEPDMKVQQETKPLPTNKKRRKRNGK